MTAETFWKSTPRETLYSWSLPLEGGGGRGAGLPEQGWRCCCPITKAPPPPPPEETLKHQCWDPRTCLWPCLPSSSSSAPPVAPLVRPGPARLSQ